MSGTVKAVIAGIVILVIGTIIFVITLACNGWSFKGAKYEMQKYVSANGVNCLDLEIGAGALKFEYSDIENIEIDYPESSQFNVSVGENAGKLSFSFKKKWYASFLSWYSPEIIIRLPSVAVYDLNLDMNAGTVYLGSGNFGDVSLDIDAGTVKIMTANCESLRMEMNAGTFRAEEIICPVIDVDMSAGTMTAAKVTADRTKVNLDAGTLKLGFTGDRAEYGISSKISAGSCNVSSQTGSTTKTIDVDLSAGTAKFEFNV